MLNQIARRYEDGDAADVAAVDNLPEQIARADGRRDSAGGADVSRIPSNYVKVTLMPAAK